MKRINLQNLSIKNVFLSFKKGEYSQLIHSRSSKITHSSQINFCLLSIISLLLLTATVASAQLTLEGKINSKYKTIQTDDGIVRYAKYNKNEKKVLLFNLDHSLWREISLPLPKFHFLDDIKLVSVHTFNTDDKVELVYSCVVYEPAVDFQNPEISILPMEFTLNIINEDGQLLLSVPNSNEMELLESNGQKKLFVYKHMGKQFSDDDQTLIYSF